MQPENQYPRQQMNNDDMNALVGKSLGQFRVVERIGAAAALPALTIGSDRRIGIDHR